MEDRDEIFRVLKIMEYTLLLELGQSDSHGFQMFDEYPKSILGLY